MMYNIGVQSWTSAIVSICFIGRLLLANMGLVGSDLGKVLLCVIHETLTIDRPNITLRTPAC